MKYAFIEEQRTQFAVRRMCAVLSVSHSGYYEWRDRPLSARDQCDEELVARVVAVHAKSRKTYGRPRIHAALKREGFCVGHNRVARLMRRAEIRGVAPRRFCVTTNSRHNESISANIVARRFAPVEISGPNRAWAGDVTFVPTKEGWLYLAVVIDLYSRMIVGWSMSAANDTQLVVAAFEMALNRRSTSGATVFHSDRGSTYASAAFRARLRARGFVQSMSRKGNCWDNAVVESFFGTLKGELGNLHYESRNVARSSIFNYIETWYNQDRLHSTLGYRSPKQFESLLPTAA